MCAVKIKLTFQAIGILTSVLPPNAMGVIYLMGMGMTMPDDVTKQDLINVISVLCKKLDWIEEEKRNEQKLQDWVQLSRHEYETHP